MNKLDAKALLQLAAGPFEIGVDVFGAAPGVEIDGLALRIGKHDLPFRRVGIGSERAERHGQRRYDAQKRYLQPGLPIPMRFGGD